MGRHKFRLSDMIPNAWFYKLRDMRARGVACPGTASSGGGVTQASLSRSASRACRLPSTPRHGAWLPHRASYYYTPRVGEVVDSPLHPKGSDTHFPPLPLSPPRKSKRRHRRRLAKLAPSAGGGLVSSPVSAGCRCGRKSELSVEAPDTPSCRRDKYVGYDVDEDGEFQTPTVTIPADDDLDGKVITSATDIIIDLRTKKKSEKALPPIVTKPARREPDGCELQDKHIDLSDMTQRTSCPASEQRKSKPRRSLSSPRRLKTRMNSPRVAAKKARPAAPRAPVKAPPLAESFAVVKSSCDPKRDFRESMEEMIAENGIRAASDLEDLLACYLSLNAAEYHDLIVEVFEHVWTSLADIKL